MTRIENPTAEAPRWQQAMQQAFTKPAALLDYLGLHASDMPHAIDASRQFPLRVPLGFARRMQPSNPRDPLLLQVWPQPQEDTPVHGFVQDAVGDLAKRSGNGLIHKYQGRALVVLTGACAVHCRYCFRRHFPYAEAQAQRSQWQPLWAALAADASIEEVILSGGDPLSLTDEKLQEFVDGLARIAHLRRLRVHSRTPIVLPERVTDALVHCLSSTRLKTVLVLHANHAQELDHEVAVALRKLRAAGLPLLNQAVLLKGVNDQISTLKQLSETLFDLGVLPYYLHLLDRVAGAAHFEVAEARAIWLCRTLAEQLPGYLVPRLARETAGEPYKTWINFQ